MNPCEIFQQEIREWQRANLAREQRENRAVALLVGCMAIAAVTICAYLVLAF